MHAGTDAALFEEVFRQAGDATAPGTASDSAFRDFFWAATDHAGSVRDVLRLSNDVFNHLEYGAHGEILLAVDPSKGDVGSTNASAAYQKLAIDTAFASREWDAEAGLYYNRARWYDAAQGRFISEDPIGLAGGDINVYRYAGGDPANYTDPSGLFLDKIWDEVERTVKKVGKEIDRVGEQIDDYVHDNGGWATWIATAASIYVGFGINWGGTFNAVFGFSNNTLFAGFQLTWGSGGPIGAIANAITSIPTTNYAVGLKLAGANGGAITLGIAGVFGSDEPEPFTPEANAKPIDSPTGDVQQVGYYEDAFWRGAGYAHGVAEGGVQAAGEAGYAVGSLAYSAPGAVGFAWRNPWQATKNTLWAPVAIVVGTKEMLSTKLGYAIDNRVDIVNGVLDASPYEGGRQIGNPIGRSAAALVPGSKEAKTLLRRYLAAHAPARVVDDIPQVSVPRTTGASSPVTGSQWYEALSARYGAQNVTWSRVPAHGGGKTQGVLATPVGDIDLLSGYTGPSAAMARGQVPGMNYHLKAHVEAHAASTMRQLRLNDATLYLNQVPCVNLRGGCEAMLPRMLGEGRQLRVVVPGQLDRVYNGVAP